MHAVALVSFISTCDYQLCRCCFLKLSIRDLFALMALHGYFLYIFLKGMNGNFLQQIRREKGRADPLHVRISAHRCFQKGEELASKRRAIVFSFFHGHGWTP
jgi:hypothetical protein